MKKQLLIAAVAATMGTAAIADISMTGNAKFEYFNTQLSTGADTNTANTEVNLKVAGKNGDTSVVANFELNTHGGNTANGAGIDIEDLYMTTKVGDVTVKGGNYASGTSGIMGEIDNGPRANNKVTLSTTISGVKVYAGNGSAAGNGATEVTSAMFVGASTTIAGWKVEAKKLNALDSAVAVSGDIQGFGIRLEAKESDTANSDVTFGHLTYSVADVNLAYAWISADADGKIGEDDSAIFAVENAGSGDSNGQFSAKTTIAGNTVTVKAGAVGFKDASTSDRDYAQIGVTRALAAGSTLGVTYTDKDTANTTTSETFEIDLSVKF
jgi:hypothetical protein